MNDDANTVNPISPELKSWLFEDLEFDDSTRSAFVEAAQQLVAAGSFAEAAAIYEFLLTMGEATEADRQAYEQYSEAARSVEIGGDMFGS